MVRVRPLNERELKEEATSCVIFDQTLAKTIKINTKSSMKDFNFDYVVG